MKKEKIIIIEVYQINRKLFFFPLFFIKVYLPPKKGLLSGDPNYTTLYQGLLPLFAQQFYSLNPKIEANVIFKIETKIPKIRN